MKVSELARRAGVAPSAVRFYEEIGVLPPAARRDNGYREYGDEALARLRLVVALRRLGLARRRGRPFRGAVHRPRRKSTSISSRSLPASAPRSSGSVPISTDSTPN